MDEPHQLETPNAPAPVGPAKARRWWSWAMMTPALAGVAVFFVAPFVTFVVYSFMTSAVFSYSVEKPFTASNYSNVLHSPSLGQLAINSIVVGLCGSVVTVGIAIPVAYWLRYCAGRWQLPALFLFTGTIFASYLVRIYAWRVILGDHGILNTALQDIGVIHQPLGFLLFSRFAVTVALVHIMLPFIILLLFAAFRPLEPRYLEAADDLGASAIQRWRRVVIPLIAGPAASAFAFAFILAASDYVTPQFLGGTKGSLIGVEIQNQFKALGDYGSGAAISLVVLVSMLAFYALVMLGIKLLRLDRIQWTT